MLRYSYDKDSVTGTEIGYTGHRYDSNSELTYAHARYLNNHNKVWLSHDPFSVESFSSDVWLLNPQMQNSYSYSTNDPVNKMDPDGKLTIFVPGIWHSPTNWSAQGGKADFLSSLGSVYGETPMVYGWNGGNNLADLNTAAAGLADYINNYQFAPGEQLNLIGHSHGGNIEKLAINQLRAGLKVDNFVTFATPARSDIRTNMFNVNNRLEVYSRNDTSQKWGGDSISFTGVLGYYINMQRTPYDGGFAGAASVDFLMSNSTNRMYMMSYTSYAEFGRVDRFEFSQYSVDVTNLTPWNLNPASVHGEVASKKIVEDNRVNVRLKQ